MSQDINWLNRRDATVKDRSKIEKAAEKQDSIRESSGKGELSGEVRKWRDKRK
jgi:hypothetical protein